MQWLDSSEVRLAGQPAKHLVWEAHSTVQKGKELELDLHHLKRGRCNNKDRHPTQNTFEQQYRLYVAPPVSFRTLPYAPSPIVLIL